MEHICLKGDWNTRQAVSLHAADRTGQNRILFKRGRHKQNVCKRKSSKTKLLLLNTIVYRKPTCAYTLYRYPGSGQPTSKPILHDELAANNVSHGSQSWVSNSRIVLPAGALATRRQKTTLAAGTKRQASLSGHSIPDNTTSSKKNKHSINNRKRPHGSAIALPTT